MDPSPDLVSDISGRSGHLLGHRGSIQLADQRLGFPGKGSPEFGKLSTPARQEQRRKNITSSAVAIYGMIGAMSTMYARHIDPDLALKEIGTSEEEDLFSWKNPVWTEAGVVTPSGSGTLTTRNSFPARRAAVRVLREAMEIGPDAAEEV